MKGSRGPGAYSRVQAQQITKIEDTNKVNGIDNDQCLRVMSKLLKAFEGKMLDV